MFLPMSWCNAAVCWRMSGLDKLKNLRRINWNAFDFNFVSGSVAKDWIKSKTNYQKASRPADSKPKKLNSICSDDSKASSTCWIVTRFSLSRMVVPLSFKGRNFPCATKCHDKHEARPDGHDLRVVDGANLSLSLCPFPPPPTFRTEYAHATTSALFPRS
jgi:hypothetical protein